MSSIPNSAMPHAGGPSASSEHGSQQDQARPERFGSTGSGNYRSPESYGGSEGSYEMRTRGGTSLMDRAREHKTGIAVGVAVGAIAAAAIPFMLSGKRRPAQYDRDLYVNDATRDAEGGAATSTYRKPV